VATDTDKARTSTRENLRRLRARFGTLGIDGWIVPHADEHQSEYLPAAAERLAWLTGFTGSAGLAIVLSGRAALFVDGRYTLQARAEVDGGSFNQEHVTETPPAKWLAAHARPGERIGYDPWLMTVADIRRYGEAVSGAGAELVALADNPLDAVWTDRPAPPLGAVSLHPVQFAGESAAAKLDRLRSTLAERKVAAAVLTQPDSIAWTLNLRGADIAHNPAPLAFAVIRASGRPSLFIDGRKLSNSVRTALAEIAEIDEPGAFPGALRALGAEKAKVLLDPQSAAEAVRLAIVDAGGTVVEGQDPAILPKAKKNAVELAGARAAHLRDGAAMVRFLAWLDRVPPGTIDEIAAAERLAALRADTARRDGAELADLSFATISGAGPNGAIVHYRVSPATARKLDKDTLYLVDSGAQYRDGTTDVTRTVPIGAATDEMRERFTRVLKGHIAIATARFPVGTTGAQLDSLARISLWQAGLDYDHGTGHGVGSYLSVHEGPARISKLGTAALEPGMIVSNEPGYYKPGAYGIRIENLVAVMPPAAVPGGDRDMLAFETLTLCPIDRRLIEPGLLGTAEIAWLDAYHAKLLPALSHLLEPAERDWLAAASLPLG
jgi:Xaa-Pro aminopeptidase